MLRTSGSHKSKDRPSSSCILNPYHRDPQSRSRHIANCQGFDLNIERGDSSCKENTVSDINDAEISNLINLFEQKMSSSNSKRMNSNEAYKRRLVHLALYRSSLPKFNDAVSGDASYSTGTGKSSGERSLHPKSVWSEDTPKLANLSNETMMMPTLNQGHTEKLKPKLIKGKNKLARGKPHRVRYCMTEKSTTLKFLQRLATNHFDTKEYSAALEVFEEILRIVLSNMQVDIADRNKRLHADTEILASAYYNVAICQFYLRDFIQATTSFKRAIKAKNKYNHGDLNDLSIAKIHALLGMSFYQSYHFQESVQHYRKSLTIRTFCMEHEQRKRGQSSLEVIGDLSDIECAKLWNNIGCAQFEMGLFDEAKFSFNESYDIAKKLLDKDNVLAYNKHITCLGMADCLINLATIDIEFGYFDEALRQLQEAFSLQQSVLGKGHPVLDETREKLEFLAISMSYQKGDINLKDKAHRVVQDNVMNRSDQSTSSGDTYRAQESGGCNAIGIFSPEYRNRKGIKGIWNKMQSDFKEAMGYKSVSRKSDPNTNTHDDEQNVPSKSDDETEVVPYSLRDRMASF